MALRRSALQSPPVDTHLPPRVELRIEQELPPAVTMALPGGGAVVPVVTADEVERAHPAHGEVLARHRSRRSLGA